MSTPALTGRPTLTGTRHMVSSGHYLASLAGFEVLEAGGNAIDAGVAAGIALGVVHSDFVNFGGVAPILVRLATTGEVFAISGLGTWPRAATLETYLERFGGSIPAGVHRSVVPSAPDAWLTALEHFGTMRFGEVAAAATRFARDGFAMHGLMAELLAEHEEHLRRWDSNAAIYLPGGRPPQPGEVFVQRDLGATLQYMADEEAAAGGDRRAGIDAARRAFYQGDIAAAIADYHREHGGFMTREDLADFRVEVEAPVHATFRGTHFYSCQTWCQGPLLLQMLRLAERADVGRFAHNSADYLHHLVEAMKLCFADREAAFTDPRFGEVPLARLLADDYLDVRAALIDSARAAPDMPAAGVGVSLYDSPVASGPVHGGAYLDTSHASAVDGQGNAFSATPSDACWHSPVIPGTGLCVSPRGNQSWAVAGHPCALAPGKRPRLTPSPGLAVRDADFVMPFGTPGGDVQCQAMAQVMLNRLVFDMDLQAAVEAPRVASQSFPNSFEPHQRYPGRLCVEARIGADIGDALAARGHVIEWWPERTWRAGGVCLVHSDVQSGVLSGAADPRRTSYAVGW